MTIFFCYHYGTSYTSYPTWQMRFSCHNNSYTMAALEENQTIVTPVSNLRMNPILNMIDHTRIKMKKCRLRLLY